MKYYYIYRITNLINGKTYIGQHRYQKLNDHYMGSGVALKNAIKKYGLDNFKKEIIYSRIKLQETADSLEILSIKKEKSIGKAEYNLIAGGHGYRPTLCKAKTESHKQKISDALKGRHFSEEHRKYLSESKVGNTNAKGSIRSDEWREKQRIAQSGKKQSVETKQKRSNTCKARLVPIIQAYHDYKKHFPNTTWNAFQRIYKESFDHV